VTERTATGVIEAPLEKVYTAILKVHEGRIRRTNAPLLAAIPGSRPPDDRRHPARRSGTLLTYRAVNVAPPTHRDRPLVRLQFWLGARLNLGLRSALRHIAQTVDCHTYPGT
jgi:hypothetical protein